MTSPLNDYPVLIFDGACGTNLQLIDIPEAAWEGCDGCNELLSVTAPDIIVDLHRQFFEAGAHVVEANTFGATSIVLAEYGLEDRVEEINHAAVAAARKAVDGQPDRFIAGSIGPTTKLVSLGHIDRQTQVAAFTEQTQALLQAGVDCLIIETCQDLMQVKNAVVTAFEVMEATGIEVPILVSVTIEAQGTMLVGSDIGAVCATLEPYPIFSLGLNCGTGPLDMESHIRYLGHHWPQRVSCIPNQGLPEVVDGQTVYKMDPPEYAQHMANFVSQFGVSVVGGCCGTTPAHTRAMAKAVTNLQPATREVSA